MKSTVLLNCIAGNNIISFVRRKLKCQLQCVNPKSVGLAGMNYGGYVAGMTLYADRDSQMYRCALLGSPIDSWMSVLSLYAERYMGTLTETNKNSSLEYNLSDLSKRLVYLVHGRLNEDFDRSTNLFSMFTAAGVQRSNNVSGVFFYRSSFLFCIFV